MSIVSDFDSHLWSFDDDGVVEFGDGKLLVLEVTGQQVGAGGGGPLLHLREGYHVVQLSVECQNVTAHDHGGG